MGSVFGQKISLFFAGAALALASGCRPSMLPEPVADLPPSQPENFFSDQKMAVYEDVARDYYAYKGAAIKGDTAAVQAMDVFLMLKDSICKSGYPAALLPAGTVVFHLTSDPGSFWGGYPDRENGPAIIYADGRESWISVSDDTLSRDRGRKMTMPEVSFMKGVFGADIPFQNFRIKKDSTISHAGHVSLGDPMTIHIASDLFLDDFIRQGLHSKGDMLDVVLHEATHGAQKLKNITCNRAVDWYGFEPFSDTATFAHFGSEQQAMITEVYYYRFLQSEKKPWYPSGLWEPGTDDPKLAKVFEEQFPAAAKTRRMNEFYARTGWRR